MNAWEKLKIIAVSIGTLLIPIVINIQGHEYSKVIKEKETQLRFVELSIEILTEKEGNENLYLRKWATDIINSYSEIPLNDSITIDLISNKIKLPKSQKVNFLLNQDHLRSADAKYNLLDLILSKKLMPTICDANNLLRTNESGRNIPHDACSKFRDVLRILKTFAFSEKDRKIIEQADTDFDSGNFARASIEYKMLFAEYYNYCTY